MRYMLLTYYKKPNGQVDESVTVARNIKPRDYQTSNVILDFKKLTVVQCSMGGIQVPKDWDKLLSYYYTHYSSTIDRLLKENGYEIVKSEQATEIQPQTVDPS